MAAGEATAARARAGGGAREAPRTQSEAAPPGAAISASGLQKRFRLPREQPSTLKERALHPFRRSVVDELQALDGVSFDVAEGEFFGIVGRNGSGKSTLLKILAGIYRPDEGEVRVRGSLSPFIELGVGFNQEMAARDNVLVNCSLLGLSRSEALDRFPAIIEFAELEDFTSLKLRNYSSGMQVRLAFSTAIQVDAAIILLDEVLAVGDIGFQVKCYDTFRRMKREGRTIVLVSHDTDAIVRFCDRAMLLERGKVEAIGEPRAVVDEYRGRINEIEESDLPDPRGTEARRGDPGSAEIVRAWVEGPDGSQTDRVGEGEPFVIGFDARFHDSVERPVLGIVVRDEGGRSCFAANTFWDGVDTGAATRGDVLRFRASVENVFSPGHYSVTAAVAYDDKGRYRDMSENAAGFTIAGERRTGAVADPPHSVEVRRI